MERISDIAAVALQTGVLTNQQNEIVNHLLYTKKHDDRDLLALDILMDGLMSAQVRRELDARSLQLV